MQLSPNEQQLCLLYKELVPEIMTDRVYRHLQERKQIIIHGRGGNGRPVLIEFNSLPDKYKKAVKEKYGDPYKYLEYQPFLDAIEIDSKAWTFYNDYDKLANGKKLPEDYVSKYTKSASWLNKITQLLDDKRALKRELNVSIEGFWRLLREVIIQEGVELPKSDKFLKVKVKEYRENGYESLIEKWRFGNNNSAKVKDEVAEALLLELIAHPHKHDDTVIVQRYNDWAKENARKAITASAVGHWRRNNAYLLTSQRDGASINYSKYSKRILRDRPSAPLLLINSDDNILDLYFVDQVTGNNYYRPAIYVIIDAHNDYILGYAVGKSITVDLVKEAYRNANRHVMELTGESYSWQQIQTDHWSISGKNTTPLEHFLSNQGAAFTPTALRNAQGKYIERSFGTVWHQTLKMFPNYSGHNITSKERINPDAIQVKNFPSKAHVEQVVAGFIEMMRNTINPATNLPRKQEWIEAFTASEKSKKLLLDDAQRLQAFGKLHSHKNKLTAAGLQPTIEGRKTAYDIPAEILWEYNGKQVDIMYDPMDLSKILITDGVGLRLVAREFEKMPSALADYKTGDRARLNNYLEEKTTIMERIGDKLSNRKELLERNGIDRDSILQAGITIKEISHAAQRAVTPRQERIQEAQEEEITIKNLIK